MDEVPGERGKLKFKVEETMKLGDRRREEEIKNNLSLSLYPISID